MDPVTPQQRKKILRVLFISLLLDLVSTKMSRAQCKSLTKPDLIYLHPPSFPFSTHLLSRSGDSPLLGPQPHLALSQCI